MYKCFNIFHLIVQYFSLHSFFFFFFPFFSPRLHFRFLLGPVADYSPLPPLPSPSRTSFRLPHNPSFSLSSHLRHLFCASSSSSTLAYHLLHLYFFTPTRGMLLVLLLLCCYLAPMIEDVWSVHNTFSHDYLKNLFLLVLLLGGAYLSSAYLFFSLSLLLLPSAPPPSPLHLCLPLLD